jgi:hypothetical protein
VTVLGTLAIRRWQIGSLLAPGADRRPDHAPRRRAAAVPIPGSPRSSTQTPPS